MTTNEIKKLHTARPFQPFTLHLADGRKVQVRHPEFMMQSPGGRCVYVADPKGGLDRIDLLLVVSLSTTNGEKGSEGRWRKAS